ncbi:hypothetical protein HG531_005064 [Fusarium graminearum]|nr:hypothetical protein HG531_005064 [Fusarium graminearum]
MVSRLHLTISAPDRLFREEVVSLERYTLDHPFIFAYRIRGTADGFWQILHNEFHLAPFPSQVHAHEAMAPADIHECPLIGVHIRKVVAVNEMANFVALSSSEACHCYRESLASWRVFAKCCKHGLFVNRSPSMVESGPRERGSLWVGTKSFQSVCSRWKEIFSVQAHPGLKIGVLSKDFGSSTVCYKARHGFLEDTVRHSMTQSAGQVDRIQCGSSLKISQRNGLI